MDLNGIVQNLAQLTLPRSRSRSPEREVKLQVLPHHAKESYQQIDARPGEDILKTNFSRLVQQLPHSETPTPHNSGSRGAPSVSRRSIIQGHGAEPQHTGEANPPQPVPAAVPLSLLVSHDEERHEQAVREESLRQSELLRLGSRIRDDQATRTLAQSAPVPAPAQPASRDVHQDLVALKAEIVSQLGFFGVDRSKATEMASVIEGRDKKADYDLLLRFIPNLSGEPLECSPNFLGRCMLHILNGGRASPDLADSDLDQEGRLITPEPSPSRADMPLSPGSASRMTPQDSPLMRMVEHPTHAPSLLSPARPVFSPPTQSPQSLSRSLTPGSLTPRAQESSFTPLTSPVPRSGSNAPPPCPPQDDWVLTDHWEQAQRDQPQSSPRPVTMAPSVVMSEPPARPQIDYPPVPAAITNPPPPPPLAPVYLPMQTSSITGVPVTPVRAPLSVGQVNESISAVMSHSSSAMSHSSSFMSHSSSASPSASLFSAHPQRKEIPIRGKNCRIQAHMYTATSPGRVDKPPALSPRHTPSIGDLLFNKFPSANSNLRNAQVWMWTQPAGALEPGWEDISQTFGSFTNPLTHPGDRKRYLIRDDGDGTPGWVTEKTFDKHRKEAAEAAQGN